MEQEKIAKEVLTLLGNNHTKLKGLEEIEVNYYNFLTDTIYLTTNVNKKKQAKGLENANPFCGNLVTICHECMHSMQAKTLHILNLILSNLSIVLAIVSIILILTIGKALWVSLVSVTIILAAILVRVVLELEAIKKSLVLSEQVLTKCNIENVKNKDIQQARKIVKRLMPLQVIQMVLDKLIMLVIVVI